MKSIQGRYRKNGAKLDRKGFCIAQFHEIQGFCTSSYWTIPVYRNLGLKPFLRATLPLMTHSMISLKSFINIKDEGVTWIRNRSVNFFIKTKC